MPIPVVTQAYREVVEFLSRRPMPEQVLAFHASPEVNARAHELLVRERDGDVTEEEGRELERYVHVEHFVRLLKAEAHRQLAEQAKQQRPV